MNIIELKDLCPDQPVKMIGIYDGKIGLLKREIVPGSYQIRVDGRTVVAGADYFEIMKENKKATKETCLKIQWLTLHTKDGIPCCPDCEEKAEMIIGLIGEPCWAHK